MDLARKDLQVLLHTINWNNWLTVTRLISAIKIWIFWNKYLPLIAKLHWINGSPVYDCMQVHIGVWLITWHSVLLPQDPMQGSRHFWFIQANRLGHSMLLIHSGLQFGGLPVYSGKQEHNGDSLTILHWAFEPQGDGWQGFTFGSISLVTKKWVYKEKQSNIMNLKFK